MFTRCLSCHRPFAENQSLEHLRSGRRLAYDPDRGRIWTLCDACRAWTLAPIQERWEALEELERVTRDQGRLLAATDHVSLIEVEDLEVVRVGEANLREEAWWRYGSELRRRRRGHTVNRVLETGALVGLTIATGGGAYYLGEGSALSSVLRWRRFGRVAWRGYAECSTCGRTVGQIRFRDAKSLRLDVAEEFLAAVFPCPHCHWARPRRPQSGFRLTGAEGDHVLRRVLSYRNHIGGDDKQVRDAAALLEAAGSPVALLAEFARTHRSLGQVGSVRKHLPRSLALEIAVNDDAERRLLRMELSAIEARWREEEEIAAIIDGELTPLPAGTPPATA